MTSRIAYNNPGRNGSLGLPYHYELLADRARLEPLKQAITLSARGRRVLESGAGSGILSILAARSGARIVYATEPDPNVAQFTRENVARSGYANIIKVIERDTRSVTLCELDGCRVDMVIAEHLSTWQVTEGQVPVMNYVNKNLAEEGAVRIPEWAENCVELACSNFRFEDVVELRTAYFGFSGIPEPTLLSDPKEAYRVHFNFVNPTSIRCTVDVKATQSGTVNSLRLTSPLLIFPKIAFQSSDSLVPPVIIPLEMDVRVSAGDFVEVHIEYECETDWIDVRSGVRVMQSR